MKAKNIYYGNIMKCVEIKEDEYYDECNNFCKKIEKKQGCLKKCSIDKNC